MFVFGGYVLPFPTVVVWMKKQPFFASYNIDYELTCKSAFNDWLDDQGADERIYVQGVDRMIGGEPIWHIFVGVHEIDDPKAPIHLKRFDYEKVPDIMDLEAWLKNTALTSPRTSSLLSSIRRRARTPSRTMPEKPSSSGTPKTTMLRKERSLRTKRRRARASWLDSRTFPIIGGVHPVHHGHPRKHRSCVSLSTPSPVFRLMCISQYSSSIMRNPLMVTQTLERIETHHARVIAPELLIKHRGLR
jgi:hypothetical protein